MKVFLSDLPNCEENAEDEGKTPAALGRDSSGYFPKGLATVAM